ncbi:MmgE/PrpD family protein [Chloroflexota bacterium]
MTKAIYAIAEFCHRLSYAELPPEIIDKVKLLVMDVFGNLIAGRNCQSSDILSDYTVAQGGTAEATLVGSKIKYPAANVVLANCAMAHSLDYDDTHNASCVHMGAAIVPSALAVVEKEGGTARDFITAIVAGAEIAARVGVFLNPQGLYARGYHPSCLCNPFGVAAAIGKLLRLTPDQIVNAFGLAGLQSFGLLRAHEKGALSWYFQYARAAQSGIYAAYLARAGLTGPAGILEGNGDKAWLASIHNPEADARLLTEGLGKGFALKGLSFKLRSCLHFGQASTDALLQVLQDNQLSYTDIDKIHLHLPSTAFNIIDATGYPATPTDAQASPRYIMAVAAIDRKVSPAQFTQERVSDNSLRQFAQHVRLSADKTLDDFFPACWPALVDVTTKDGKSYSCLVKNARGDADNPPSLSEIQEKFRGLASGLLKTERSEALLEQLNTLESMDDMCSLAQTLSEVELP